MGNLIAPVLILLCVSPALAWGPEGHRIVADIAATRLTPAARLQIIQLLGNDDLAAISLWADDIKAERPETAGWHFVDIPMKAPAFSEPRDCYRPEPSRPYTLRDHHNCVVDRITMYEEVLENAKTPRQQRVEALKFLVHFVGDIHQPMHAIGEARGGNDIHIADFGSAQCGKYACNLHYAWDIGLIEHTGLSEAQYVSRLDEDIDRQKLIGDWRGNAAGWANESLRLARKAWLNDGGTVDEQYFTSNIAVLDERLAIAGLRLAAVLNQALGTKNFSSCEKMIEHHVNHNAGH